MKILIVEDDQSSRIYLENLLELNGYKFRSAVNGIEGLNYFEEYDPDIVITDIQMPIMDGLELLEAIRDKKSNTIVIITTAYGNENYAIQALHLGANNYIKKPVSGKELLPLLKKYKSVINSKFIPDQLPGEMIYQKYKIEFETSYKQIPKIVDRLLLESTCNFDTNERINIELGLVELITNAIEHGNLDITYDEKQEALNDNMLDELFAERLAIPDYKNKKIIVEFLADKNGIEWTITDQGNGFEWNTLPDPTDSENILELNGRGVFISKFLFDKVEYIGNGNIVKVRKNYRKN